MHTSGRSESTLNNYSRYLSQIALHFNCLPTELQEDQIEDYLHFLLKKGTPSESYFKHTIYGLRFLFRLEGLNDKRIALPSIQREKKTTCCIKPAGSLSTIENRYITETPVDYWFALWVRIALW